MQGTTASIETNEQLSPAEEDFALALLGTGWTVGQLLAGTRLPRIGIGLAAKAFMAGQRQTTDAKPATCAEACAEAAAALRKFQLGDVVQLNSGGMRMTVISECCGRMVECAIGEYSYHSDGLKIVTVDERCLKGAKYIDDELPF